MRRSVSKVDFDFNLSADIRTITAVSHISFPQRDIKVTNEKFSSSWHKLPIFRLSFRSHAIPRVLPVIKLRMEVSCTTQMWASTSQISWILEDPALFLNTLHSLSYNRHILWPAGYKNMRGRDGRERLGDREKRPFWLSVFGVFSCFACKILLFSQNGRNVNSKQTPTRARKRS